KPLIHRLGAEKKSILIGNKWNKTFSDVLTKDVIEDRTGLSLQTTIPDLSELYIRSVIEAKTMIKFSKARETLIRSFLPLCERILPLDITRKLRPRIFPFMKR